MGIQFDFESADQSSRVADRGQRTEERQHLFGCREGVILGKWEKKECVSESSSSFLTSTGITVQKEPAVPETCLKRA